MSKRSTLLKSAIKDGWVPKARRAYQLFTVDFFNNMPSDESATQPDSHSTMTPASTPLPLSHKLSATKKMKSCATAWKTLNASARLEYQARSTAEFAKQRAAVAQLGIRVRGRGYSADDKRKKCQAGEPKPLQLLKPRKRLHCKTCSLASVMAPEKFAGQPGPPGPPGPNGVGAVPWAQFGDFAFPPLVHVLGKGAYGKVVCGMQVSTGRAVAVKVFAPSDIAELAREVANYRRLYNSKNASVHFLKILGRSDANSLVPWMALELAGPSLRHHLNAHGSMTGPLLASAAKQLADGLPGPCSLA